MSDWKLVRLGDYISIKSGLAYQGNKIGKGDSYLLGMGCVSFKDKFVHSGVRLYDDRDVDGSYYVLPGDMVLATRQQSDNLPILAMPAIIPQEFKGKKIIFGTNLYKVENSSEISNRFLFWLLKHQHYVNYIAGVKSGTAVQMVTKKNVENYKFYCPPKPIREKIADILWTYDDLIEANNRRIELLEQAAQELYKEWFVRFRFPGYESIKFENGIPEDWNVSKLFQISDFVYGKMPQQEHVVENGFPIFSGYRVSGYYDSFMFEEPMLVLIARGVGGTGEVKISPPCAHITNLAIVFKLNNPDLHKRYLYHMFTLQNLRYLDTGAAQSQITIENLKNVKVILPTDGLLEKFNKIIAPFYEEQDRLKSINENLINQRDLLLPRLISGKLEV